MHQVGIMTKKAHTMVGFFKIGSPGRARTADLVINSHPLYQLSYRGIARRGIVRKFRQ